MRALQAWNSPRLADSPRHGTMRRVPSLIVPTIMASASPHAEPRRRVAIIGLGSIGGAVAGCLAAAGRHDVIACARQPLDRLTLESPSGTADLPLAVLTDPAQVAQPADWVMLCTKTHQTAAAAPWLSRLCTPATRVAVLQNGIGHVERVAPLANGAAVLPVIVYFNGERLARDRIRLRQGSDQDLAVADDAAGRDFARLFAGTPLRVSRSSEFDTLVWRKLLELSRPMLKKAERRCSP